MTNGEIEHEEIEALKLEVAKLQAAQGKVTLPPAILALFWSMQVAAFAAIGFVAHLDARVESQEHIAISLSQTIERHLTADQTLGEKLAVSNERLTSLYTRVQAIEDKLESADGIDGGKLRR